jgi:hypothetical protein
MKYYHPKTFIKVSALLRSSSTLVPITIAFVSSIEFDKNSKNLTIAGPLGKLQVHLGNYYQNHSTTTVTIAAHPPLVQILKDCDLGVRIGFRRKLLQSGV